MKSMAIGVALVGFGILAAAAAAEAAPRQDTYTVEHPTYGRIGTYVDTVDTAGGITRIESELHVAVKLLGIVVYREEAQCAEVWHGDQLIWFRSIRNKNGEESKIRGEALPDRFMVTAPYGTSSAPIDVLPSEPWALRHAGKGTVVSTASGKIVPVAASGGDPEVVSVQGHPIPVRHFVVDTPTVDHKWEIWFGSGGVPIKFRSIESGDPIDFVLTTPPPPDARFPFGLDIAAAVSLDDR